MKPAILRLPEVAEMFSLSEAAIMRKVKSGTFPQPIKLTKRAIGWKATDLQNYIDEL